MERRWCNGGQAGVGMATDPHPVAIWEKCACCARRRFSFPMWCPREGAGLKKRPLRGNEIYCEVKEQLVESRCRKKPRRNVI